MDVIYEKYLQILNEVAATKSNFERYNKKYKTNLDDGSLLHLFNDFNKVAERPELSNKNIFTYSSHDEVKKAVQNVLEIQLDDQLKKGKIKEKEPYIIQHKKYLDSIKDKASYEIIIDNDECKILKINNKEAAQLFGNNWDERKGGDATWCIARTPYSV